MIKKILLLFIIFLFLPEENFSEDFAKISGQVINKETGNPVSNTNVFIAHSMMGASTNANGEFVIKNVPFGKYTVIFSHLGYKIEQKKVRLSRKVNYFLYTELIPKPIVFPEIDVVDKSDDKWRSNFALFRERLIGIDKIADSTVILNPYHITFSKNDEGNLTAISDEPIQIENRLLGYKIIYFLKYFEAGFDDTKYAGLPVFDTLKAKNENEKMKWEKNRIDVYKGSLRHFLTVLYKNYKRIVTGMDELVLTYDWSDWNERGVKFDYDRSYLLMHGFKAYEAERMPSRVYNRVFLQPLYPDSIFTEAEQPNEIWLKPRQKFMAVDYLNKYTDKYAIMSLYDYEKRSWLKFHADSLLIDKKGRYWDEFKIQTYGYWTLFRLSRELPFEYSLPDSVLMDKNYSLFLKDYEQSDDL